MLQYKDNVFQSLHRMHEHSEYSPAPVEKSPSPSKPDVQLDQKFKTEKQTEDRLDALENSLFHLSDNFPGLDTDGFYEELCGLVYGAELPADKLESLVDTLDQYDFSDKGRETFNKMVKEGDTQYLCYLLAKNTHSFNVVKLSNMNDREFDSIRRAISDLSPVTVRVKKGEVYKGCMIVSFPSGELRVDLLYGVKESGSVTTGETPAPKTTYHSIDPNSLEIEDARVLEKQFEADLASGDYYEGVESEDIDPTEEINPFSMTDDDMAKWNEAAGSETTI